MTNRSISKAGLLFAAGYLAAGIASLAWIFISGDSLAGVLAVMVIQPWGSVVVWMMDVTGLDSFLLNVSLMFGGALVNAWVIYKAVAWIAGKIGTANGN